MNFQEALLFLYNSLPMYQRVGPSAYKKDLINTHRLCEHLGDPQKKFESIHVAGTNGKGSTAHALTAILVMAGYKVGLYTSPHLKSFTERIRVNGEEIPEAAVASFVEANIQFLQELKPSFFEMSVALAFYYFASERVDVAVVEVGLGGKLDSTNVIEPLLCLITNIGYDHQNMLGDTLVEIAAEKAGIIKPGIPVIVSEYQPEVAQVFESKAKECDSQLFYGSKNYILSYNPVMLF